MTNRILRSVASLCLAVSAFVAVAPGDSSAICLAGVPNTNFSNLFKEVPQSNTCNGNNSYGGYIQDLVADGYDVYIYYKNYNAGFGEVTSWTYRGSAVLIGAPGSFYTVTDNNTASYYRVCIGSGTGSCYPSGYNSGY